MTDGFIFQARTFKMEWMGLQRLKVCCQQGRTSGIHWCKVRALPYLTFRVDVAHRRYDTIQ